MRKKLGTSKDKIRPLSLADLQSLHPIKATQKDPRHKPDSVLKTFYVSSPDGTTISPSVKADQIDAKTMGSSLWELTIEVKGANISQLPGVGVYPVPVPRGRNRPRRVTHSSYRPNWFDVSFKPKTQPKLAQPKLWVRGRKVEPLIVFPDDRRKILVDRSWPWLLMGKIFTSDGTQGSGVLIGDRLVLTARHVLPWNSIAAGSWWMKFIPHYFDGSEPFGSSFASDLRHYDTDDDEFNMSHDYAIMRLYTPLGSRLGYLGSSSFDDDWRGLDVWYNVGYHEDIAGSERPAWQRYTIEDDYEDDDGQILETEASLEHGSSGGPFFDWFDDGQVRVIGVVGGGTDFDGDADNRLAGGDNMVNLIDWARANWPL